MTIMRIHTAIVCHPDAHNAPKCGLGRSFVEVEDLRIEAPRKRLDLLGGESVRTELDRFADDEVLVEPDHDRPRRLTPPVRPRAGQASGSTSWSSRLRHAD
jgi:hypothetical protein